jgi:hypothetical protein
MTVGTTAALDVLSMGTPKLVLPATADAIEPI